jgi:hypothetical protein
LSNGSVGNAWSNGRAHESGHTRVVSDFKEVACQIDRWQVSIFDLSDRAIS